MQIRYSDNYKYVMKTGSEIRIACIIHSKTEPDLMLVWIIIIMYNTVTRIQLQKKLFATSHH